MKLRNLSSILLNDSLSKSVFSTLRQAEEHAAYQVACFWLASAHQIIKRGESPAKLSRCAITLSGDEIDRDIYRPFNRYGKMNVGNIARDAVQIALSKLRMGQFPLVHKHFEITDDNNDFSRTQLSRVGELSPKPTP